MTPTDGEGESDDLLKWIQAFEDDFFATLKNSQVARFVVFLNEFLEDRLQQERQIRRAGCTGSGNLQCGETNAVFSRLLVTPDKMQRLQGE